MREPRIHAAGSVSMRWQYRFGMRFLLAAVLLVALILGWVAPAQRRADERTALVAELAGVGVRPILEEPTALGLVVMGGLNERHRRWLRERVGSGWFERPTVFVCGHLEDKQVPYAVERLRRLGTVHEVHTQGPGLTQQGISGLQSGLPGVEVVPSANPVLHRYFRDEVEHEHSGSEGLKLAALLALGLLCTLVFFAWPLLRRRTGGRSL
jgi:hypothetical protein